MAFSGGNWGAAWAPDSSDSNVPTDPTRSSSQQSSSTFFGSNPIADPLAELGKQATNQYMGFVQNPTAHPLYQAQIGGLLQSLIPSENRARTGLTDMFRSAGGLRSGAYGREATQLEDSLMQRRSQTAAQLLGQMFPQMVQALNNPISQIPNLLQALKLQQSQGTAIGQQQQQQTSGWENIPPSQGLDTPMYGDRTQQSPQPTYGGQPSPQTQPSSAQPIQQPWVPYLDPWSSGGGGMQTTTASPNAVDEYGYTQQDWANDPYYNN